MELIKFWVIISNQHHFRGILKLLRLPLKIAADPLAVMNAQKCRLLHISHCDCYKQKLNFIFESEYRNYTIAVEWNEPPHILNHVVVDLEVRREPSHYIVIKADFIPNRKKSQCDL